jgi:hypothetical protein
VVIVVAISAIVIMVFGEEMRRSYDFTRNDIRCAV